MPSLTLDPGLYRTPTMNLLQLCLSLWVRSLQGQGDVTTWSPRTSSRTFSGYLENSRIFSAYLETLYGTLNSLPE